jgi:hypothetical protein
MQDLSVRGIPREIDIEAMPRLEWPIDVQLSDTSTRVTAEGIKPFGRR